MISYSLGEEFSCSEKVALVMRRCMKQRLILLFILITTLAAACSPFSGIESCRTPQRIPTETSDFKFLWSEPNVLVVYNNPLDPSLIGLNSTVFAMIYRSDNAASQIIALDTQSGKMIWQRDITSQGSIIASDSTLFMANYDHIQEYDLQTGNPIRVTNFPNIGNIYNMFVSNHSLYALSSSGRWLTYNLEDQTSELSEPFLPYTPFIVDSGVLYLHDSEGFKAIRNETGETLWVRPIDETIIPHPIFIENMIIILSDIGKIYSLDKENGNLIWELDTNVISNVATDTSRLYFLTTDGYLKVLNISNGQELQKFQVSPIAFVAHQQNSSDAIGVYNMWVDSKNNTVVFSVGDSCQLIALKLKD
jgi:outer membrane protein assembly factor BamB